MHDVSQWALLEFERKFYTHVLRVILEVHPNFRRSEHIIPSRIYSWNIEIYSGGCGGSEKLMGRP